MLLFKQDCIHIFDCDGVLLDSNHAKVEILATAFKKIYSPSSFIKWAQEEFRANFGRTRSVHFDLFQEYIGTDGYRLNNVDRKKAYKVYEDGVKKLYDHCDLIKETKDYIDSLEDGNHYVVSASDQTELQKSLPKIYTSLSVNNIFGGPASKIENINKVISENPKASQFVLYGDSVADAKATIATKIDFIGLTRFSADPKGLSVFCMNNNLDLKETCSELAL